MITVDLIWKKTLTVLFSAILRCDIKWNKRHQTNKQTNIKWHETKRNYTDINYHIFLQKQSLGVKFKERKMHGFFNDLVRAVCTVILICNIFRFKCFSELVLKSQIVPEIVDAL